MDFSNHMDILGVVSSIHRIKLNFVASPIWSEEGWHILYHKLNKNSEFKIAGEASEIKLKSKS